MITKGSKRTTQSLLGSMKIATLPAEKFITVRGIKYDLVAMTPYMKVITQSEMGFKSGFFGRFLPHFIIGTGATETQVKKDEAETNKIGFVLTKVVKSKVNGRYYLYTCEEFDIPASQKNRFVKKIGDLDVFFDNSKEALSAAKKNKLRSKK